jgi:flagellin
VTSAALAFDYFMDTESGGFDLLEVHVRTGGGDTRVLAKTDFTVDRAFHNIDVDLSAFVGQNISLAFSFDTTDGIANNGEGVYLDNIVVSTDTAQLNFVLGQEETADLQTLNLNSAITREENLVSIDYAIRRFSQARSELGALHNSLESHINTLEERIFSTSSAQSRIVDADIAVEVASLAKAQITQQAAREMHALLQDSMALIVDLLE